MQLKILKKQPQAAPAGPLPATAQSVVTPSMEQYLQAAVEREYTAPINLTDAMRTRMEAHFGRSFSQVRLVRSDLPRRLGAEALAQGNLIRFAPGAFSPNTESGQRLLAHELSHVVQQSQGTGMDGIAGMPAYDPGIERAADAMARQALAGGLSVPSPALPIPTASQAPMLGNGLTDRVRKRLANRRAQRGLRKQEQNRQLDDLLALRPWKINKNLLMGAGGTFDEFRRAVDRRRLARQQQSEYDSTDWRTIPLPKLIEPENPGIPIHDEELAENVAALRNAENLEQLQRAFGEMVLDRRQFHSELSEADNLDLDKIKNRLVVMARVIRDFPELKKAIGNFKKLNRNRSTTMSSALRLWDRSDINWNPRFFERDNEHAARLLLSASDKGEITSSLYAGAHELGHVINIMLIAKNRLLTRRSDYYHHTTINRIINNALARISASNERNPGKYSWITEFMNNFAENTNRNLNIPLKIYLGSELENDRSEKERRAEEAREALYTKYHQTTQYGASNLGELFAEAFSDVYDNGRSARVLSRKIVKEAWMELNPKAAKRHQKLMRQPLEG